MSKGTPFPSSYFEFCLNKGAVDKNSGFPPQAWVLMSSAGARLAWIDSLSLPHLSPARPGTRGVETRVAGTYKDFPG